MTSNIAKVLTVASTLVLFTGTANASFMSFTLENSFLSATSDAVTDTYNDLVPTLDGGSTIYSPLLRTVSGGRYDLSTANHSSLFVGSSTLTPSGGEYISNNSDTAQSMTASLFNGLPTGAIGGYFFGSRQGPIAATVTATVFDIDGASTSLSVNCDLTPASCFIGYTSTVAIERLEFSSDTNFVGLDDLTFGNSVNPVPAPATLAMLLLGLAGLGWSRRKKA